MGDMRVPTILFVLAAGASATLPGAAPAARAADPPNPLPPLLEALSVGPATEFRLAIVHPIFAPPPADGADVVPGLASTAPPDALGVSAAPTAARTRIAVRDLGSPAGAFVLPGDVVRTDAGDFVVREHHVVRPKAEASLGVVRTSHAPAQDAPREEPRFLAPLPGPALLWVLLGGATERELVATSADLARDAGADTVRRSPDDLRDGARISARVREYRAALRVLPGPRGGIRRETVGWALVVDGALGGIEVFADGRTFHAAWEHRLDGLAVEAALHEVATQTLDAELPEPANPDRCLKDVKGALLAAYAVEPRRERLDGLGTVHAWSKDDAHGRAVLTVSGRLAHLVIAIDPARRKAPEPEDPLSPGVLERKARMTEAEKRWLERRKQQ